MHHSAHPDHARHDVALIAGHAAGDLPDTDAAAAATLLASCPACGDLHRDLVAIAAATRALPRTARAPRDFRVTAEQAARLHRGSWLRGLLRPFASARSATRPMAAAFTSLGVAGLLVATFVPGLLGGPASFSQERQGVQGAAATNAPINAPAEPLVGGPGAVGAPTAPPPAADMGSQAPEGPDGKSGTSDDPGMEVAVGGRGTDGNEDTDIGTAEERLSAESTPSLLAIGSLGLLLLGLAMFGLRLAARRVR